jgi:HSP20 family protein
METDTKPRPAAETTAAPPAPAGASPERWSPLTSLRDEIDRLFDDFDPFARRAAHLWPFGAMPAARASSAGAPPMDLVERSDAFELALELPGLSREDVEIRLAGDALIVSGEKREEHEAREGGHVHRERRFGSFRRSLRLPDGTDPKRIEASFKDGVLRVVLPKSEEARREERRIEVKAS